MSSFLQKNALLLSFLSLFVSPLRADEFAEKTKKVAENLTEAYNQPDKEKKEDKNSEEESEYQKILIKGDTGSGKGSLSIKGKKIIDEGISLVYKFNFNKTFRTVFEQKLTGDEIEGKGIFNSFGDYFKLESVTAEKWIDAITGFFDPFYVQWEDEAKNTFLQIGIVNSIHKNKLIGFLIKNEKFEAAVDIEGIIKIILEKNNFYDSEKARKAYDKNNSGMLVLGIKREKLTLSLLLSKGDRRAWSKDLPLDPSPFIGGLNVSYKPEKALLDVFEKISFTFTNFKNDDTSGKVLGEIEPGFKLSTDFGKVFIPILGEEAQMIGSFGWSFCDISKMYTWQQSGDPQHISLSIGLELKNPLNTEGIKITFKPTFKQMVTGLQKSSYYTDDEKEKFVQGSFSIPISFSVEQGLEYNEGYYSNDDEKKKEE